MPKAENTIKAEDTQLTIAAGNTEAAMQQAQQELDKAAEDAKDKVIKDSDTPLTETAAKEAAMAIAGVEQSGYSFGGFAVSTEMRREAPVTPSHPNDVKFDVTNPKDTGMPKGIVVVSKETAEHFKSIGIGKIAD